LARKTVELLQLGFGKQKEKDFEMKKKVEEMLWKLTQLRCCAILHSVADVDPARSIFNSH